MPSGFVQFVKEHPFIPHLQYWLLRFASIMVFWLVTAKPRVERLGELKRRLDSREISRMRPFGRSLENGLVNAKLREDGTALWEEEDYCVEMNCTGRS